MSLLSSSFFLRVCNVVRLIHLTLALSLFLPLPPVRFRTEKRIGRSKTRNFTNPRCVCIQVGLLHAPDPSRCLAEARRVLLPSGIIACSSWAHPQWDDILRLISTVRPDKRLPEMPADWATVATMQQVLEGAGFHDVAVFEVPTTMEFERIEPFMEFMARKLPFMQGLIGDMNEEEMERLARAMVDAGREMCPTEPGRLLGMALVAVGRK